MPGVRGRGRTDIGDGRTRMHGRDELADARRAHDENHGEQGKPYGEAFRGAGGRGHGPHRSSSTRDSPRRRPGANENTASLRARCVCMSRLALRPEARGSVRAYGVNPDCCCRAHAGRDCRATHRNCRRCRPGAIGKGGTATVPGPGATTSQGGFRRRNGRLPTPAIQIPPGHIDTVTEWLGGERGSVECVDPGPLTQAARFPDPSIKSGIGL